MAVNMQAVQLMAMTGGTLSALDTTDMSALTKGVASVAKKAFGALKTGLTKVGSAIKKACSSISDFTSKMLQGILKVFKVIGQLPGRILTNIRQAQERRIEARVEEASTTQNEKTLKRLAKHSNKKVRDAANTRIRNLPTLYNEELTCKLDSELNDIAYYETTTRTSLGCNGNGRSFTEEFEEKTIQHNQSGLRAQVAREILEARDKQRATRRYSS